MLGSSGTQVLANAGQTPAGVIIEDADGTYADRDADLTDASFDPGRCNPVVVTGYLQPRAHLATRDPLSQLKLYNGGLLRDRKRGLDFSHIDPDTLHRPTYVNAGGSALFSNIMLHSFTDDFTPRLAPERIDWQQGPQVTIGSSRQHS